ncbi:MAG: glycosyltransferase family 4 protein [Planctomycetes bacterium]|nr:glycosyltransferase family 4 protein [Planctomycetota bacterium]
MMTSFNFPIRRSQTVRDVASLNVVLLTNFIPPHQRPAYEELSRRVGKLTLLLSTHMEADREWDVRWGDLDVRVQRTLSLRRPRKHPLNFDQQIEVHIPWDTLGQLRRLKPDVVISDELGFRSLFCAGRRILHPATRLVVCGNLSEHTEQGRGQVRRLLRRRLVRFADCVTYNGSSGAEYLRRLGTSPERMAHVPYCPAPEALYRGPFRQTSPNETRLLYVGHFNQLKGIVPFTQALARWARANTERVITFSLVGAGPLEKELASLSTPDNLTVELLGTQPIETLPSFYANADMFAFPSLADEWGLVVNEALHAGLPVVGSTFSQAVLDLIDDQVTGWKYRPDCDNAMEQAIRRALDTSTEKLSEMRSSCRERVCGITPSFVADRLVDAITVTQTH